jgi:hypothetical protein
MTLGYRPRALCLVPYERMTRAEGNAQIKSNRLRRINSFISTEHHQKIVFCKNCRLSALCGILLLYLNLYYTNSINKKNRQRI